MGSVGDVFDSAVHALSLGTIDLRDSPEVTNSTASIREDQKANSRKRKALYGTTGGALGEDVNTVGQNNRGTLFGN